ncbi:hypothetical protein J6TS2_51640 [Heyndrickxia sporothermodurans]|nr:hypothetical protein J6TS2_51640 [Heyndrickxia sporothermodurans]
MTPFQTGYFIYLEVKSEGGRVRHLANDNGDAILEHLEEFNDMSATTLIQL